MEVVIVETTIEIIEIENAAMCSLILRLVCEQPYSTAFQQWLTLRIWLRKSTPLFSTPFSVRYVNRAKNKKSKLNKKLAS